MTIAERRPLLTRLARVPAAVALDTIPGFPSSLAQQYGILFGEVNGGESYLTALAELE